MSLLSNNLLIYFIDSIEANVDSTAVHVEDATVQLHKASNYQVCTFASFQFVPCYKLHINYKQILVTTPIFLGLLPVIVSNALVAVLYNLS